MRINFNNIRESSAQVLNPRYFDIAILLIPVMIALYAIIFRAAVVTSPEIVIEEILKNDEKLTRERELFNDDDLRYLKSQHKKNLDNLIKNYKDLAILLEKVKNKSNETGYLLSYKIKVNNKEEISNSKFDKINLTLKLTSKDQKSSYHGLIKFIRYISEEATGLSFNEFKIKGNPAEGIDNVEIKLEVLATLNSTDNRELANI
ncbi:MAG: hypothetical protein ACN4E2_05175 [Nitrospinota bacterium]